MRYNYNYNYDCDYDYNYATTCTTTITATTTTTASISTTLQLQLQLPLYYNYHYHYSYKLQLQLQPQLHYNYNYNYHYHYATLQLHHTTPHYIQQVRVRWPLQPLQKTQLQPPFDPSVGSPCHPCITISHLSYSCLSLKLPPPPCAVLLVWPLAFYLLSLDDSDPCHARVGLPVMRIKNDIVSVTSCVWFILSMLCRNLLYHLWGGEHPEFQTKYVQKPKPHF